LLKQIILNIIFQLAILTCVFSQDTKALNNDLLNKRVSISINSIAIDKVFDELSKQTACYFTYNADQIDGNRLVSLHLSEAPLRNALDSLLYNSDFTYQLVNNQIVIHSKNIILPNIDKIIIKPKTITGKVIDAITGEPLPYASLVIKNSYVGGISNEQGVFSIKIPELCNMDTLVFYYMGYYNKEFPLNDINMEISVALEQGLVSIQEVIIRNVEPELLIKKARSLFRENYFDEDYNYEAFYREAIKKSSRYMVYSEALIQGFKPTFLNENSSNKVQLKKSRKFTNIQQSDTLVIKLRGGMEACFQLDLIHQLPDFLSEKGIEQYNYSISDITIWQNELVYVIDFKQKEYIQEALFEGVIYISVNRSVILGVDFSFSKDKLRKTSNLFVIKKSRQVAIKPVGTSYQVQYSNFNGKYFIKYVRGELTFKAKKSRKFIRENYATVMEMVYTKIDTLNVGKPLKKDLFQTNTIFSDSEYVYDADFWKESNVITPEENILDAFKSSGFKLEEQGKMEE